MNEIFHCGLDEAGRGPLAGPVVAASVILPSDFPLEILADSKKLSAKKRKIAEEKILSLSCYGIAEVSHEIIDKINILQASLLAMKLAYEKMEKKIPEWAEKNGIELSRFGGFSSDLISATADGTFCPKIPCRCAALVKADAKVYEVMAASILAKEYRDRYMIQADLQYPGYGYAAHKGYPTKAHKEAIKKLGNSPIQRLSFGKKQSEEDCPELF